MPKTPLGDSHQHQWCIHWELLLPDVPKPASSPAAWGVLASELEEGPNPRGIASFGIEEYSLGFSFWLLFVYCLSEALE